MITFLTIVLVLSLVSNWRQFHVIGIYRDEIRSRKQQLEDVRDRLNTALTRVQQYQTALLKAQETCDSYAVLAKAMEKTSAHKDARIKALEHEVKETLTACRQLQAKNDEAERISEMRIKHVYARDEIIKQRDEQIEGMNTASEALVAKLAEISDENERMSEQKQKLLGEISTLCVQRDQAKDYWHSKYAAERNLTEAYRKAAKPAVKAKTKRKAA